MSAETTRGEGKPEITQNLEDSKAQEGNTDKQTGKTSYNPGSEDLHAEANNTSNTYRRKNRQHYYTIQNHSTETTTGHA